MTCLISSNKPREKSRKEARRIHFLKRFYERVGYAITSDDYDLLQDKVKTEGRFIYRRPNESGAIYAVRYRGKNLHVVYDVFEHSLITVRPPNR